MDTGGDAEGEQPRPSQTRRSTVGGDAVWYGTICVSAVSTSFFTAQNEAAAGGGRELLEMDEMANTTEINLQWQQPAVSWLLSGLAQATTEVFDCVDGGIAAMYDPAVLAPLECCTLALLVLAVALELVIDLRFYAKIESFAASVVRTNLIRLIMIVRAGRTLHHLLGAWGWLLPVVFHLGGRLSGVVATDAHWGCRRCRRLLDQKHPEDADAAEADAEAGKAAKPSLADVRDPAWFPVVGMAKGFLWCLLMEWVSGVRIEDHEWSGVRVGAIVLVRTLWGVVRWCRLNPQQRQDDVYLPSWTEWLLPAEGQIWSISNVVAAELLS